MAPPNDRLRSFSGNTAAQIDNIWVNTMATPIERNHPRRDQDQGRLGQPTPGLDPPSQHRYTQRVACASGPSDRPVSPLGSNIPLIVRAPARGIHAAAARDNPNSSAIVGNAMFENVVSMAAMKLAPARTQKTRQRPAYREAARRRRTHPAASPLLPIDWHAVAIGRHAVFVRRDLQIGLSDGWPSAGRCVFTCGVTESRHHQMVKHMGTFA